MNRRTLIATVCGVMLAVAPLASASPILPSIVRETGAHGWPHRPTTAETTEVAQFVLRTEGPFGRVMCHFGAHMGRGYCGFVRGKDRHRVNFQTWEDGSIRTTEATR